MEDVSIVDSECSWRGIADRNTWCCGGERAVVHVVAGDFFSVQVDHGTIVDEVVEDDLVDGSRVVVSEFSFEIIGDF